MEFLLTLVGPVAVAVFAKVYYRHEISKRETVAQLAIGVAFGIIVSMMFSYGQMHDTEVITGQVIEKHRDEDSYQESYSCNCRTVTTGKTSTTTCSTCWRTVYTVDWYLESTIGNIDIDSESSYSSSVWSTPNPTNFVNAKIGEACSSTRSYINYIKASPDSLFNSKEFRNKEYDEIIPSYPRLHSVYKIDHALSADDAVSRTELAKWTHAIREQLKTSDIETNPNILFVFTSTTDRNYRYALERKWLGGKKNDLVVVIGAPSYPKATWAEVITLGGTSGNELTAVKVRRAIEGQNLDPVKTTNKVFSVVERNFDMKSIDDFEYLEDEQQISFWQGFFIVLISIIVSIIVSIIFSNNSLRSKH